MSKFNIGDKVKVTSEYGAFPAGTQGVVIGYDFRGGEVEPSCALVYVEGSAKGHDGFGKGDTTVHLGQLAESLVRLARLVVGIKLHADELENGQAAELAAELEAAVARDREAICGLLFGVCVVMLRS